MEWTAWDVVIVGLFCLSIGMSIAQLVRGP